MGMTNAQRSAPLHTQRSGTPKPPPPPPPREGIKEKKQKNPG